MAEAKGPRKVNVKTEGLTSDEILEVIHSHVSACQKATAMLWAQYGESEEVTDLRDSLQRAEKAARV